MNGGVWQLMLDRLLTQQWSSGTQNWQQLTRGLEIWKSRRCKVVMWSLWCKARRNERSNKERTHQKSEKYTKAKVIWRNNVSAFNSRAVSIVRYGAEIISWTKMKLEELDWKTRKLMAWYVAHNSKADAAEWED